MVCHGEHTYLYSQVLMHVLAQEPKGGSNIRRLCQELQKCANERWVFTMVYVNLHKSAAIVQWSKQDWYMVPVSEPLGYFGIKLFQTVI